MQGAEIVPVGVVRSTRAAVEDDDWDAVRTRIELDAERFTPEALAGLETFSHVEVIFLMDRVDEARVERGARHPRGHAAWPRVGIFAQRAKNRPNRLGVTVCRVLGVEGATLHLQGLDAVDGTPVVDIKPWVQQLGPRGEVRQPAWMDELMADYWSRRR
jgi:tRNA-Thr(GGU) m(6)t(6)A37 methyltransferase TsaA